MERPSDHQFQTGRATGRRAGALDPGFVVATQFADNALEYTPSLAQQS
ncbi:hypothetical protein GXW84_33855 [Rhodococcus sp. IEGM 248]|jgi:hypothetical protein|nr:hypothetical protein [Rhodococcus sp. IEGM 248]